MSSVLKDIAAFVLICVVVGVVGLIVERLGNIEKLLEEIRDSLRK